MVDKLKSFLNQLLGKAVVVNYDGFISGLKCYEHMDYSEDDDYIILSEQDHEDYIYIRKEEMKCDDMLLEFILMCNGTVVRISQG